MPHKRPKASARAAAKAKAGSDLAPTASDLSFRPKSKAKGRKDKAKSGDGGGVSKGVWRILNAEKTREEFRKRKLEGASGESGGSIAVKGKGKEKGKSKQVETIKLLPGENLGAFNRSVPSLFQDSCCGINPDRYRGEQTC